MQLYLFIPLLLLIFCVLSISLLILNSGAQYLNDLSLWNGPAWAYLEIRTNCTHGTVLTGALKTERKNGGQLDDGSSLQHGARGEVDLSAMPVASNHGCQD
jgi:hypothetical protein